MNKQRGITLVALAITIIVLLILSGVAISSLVGEESIIGNANSAVGKYNDKAKEEGKLLNSIEKYFIEYTSGEDVTVTATNLKYEIFTNEPAVIVIEEENNEISKYFEIETSGESAITSTVYADESNTEVENTSDLAVGTHTVTCTVTKENGMSASASVMIIVKENLPNITTASGIHSETTEYMDTKGNKIVVPGGFSVRTDLAATVPNGIVIEDGNGNQFVWVPVGWISRDDEWLANIELGRYKFDEENGRPILVQKSTEYESEIYLENQSEKNIAEVKSYRESDYAIEYYEAVNATAYDLQAWIESAQVNEGYYIARYEASFGSGDVVSSVTYGEKAITNQKPFFKQSDLLSEENTITSVTSQSGTLWNNIRQGDASLACINMYNGNEYNDTDFVQSDLVNSYAWDTAVVYIEKCSNDPMYEQKIRMSSFYNTGIDTGKTTDLVCNIYDISGNLSEWTTETCYRLWGHTGDVKICIYVGSSRGGYSEEYGYRCATTASLSSENIGFRATLCIKN